MNLGILGKFFDSNEREINKLKPLVIEINALEAIVKKLKDKDFPKKNRRAKKTFCRGRIT